MILEIWAEGLGAVRFVVRSSRIAWDMLLSLFVLTSPPPLCSPGADYPDSLEHCSSEAGCRGCLIFGYLPYTQNYPSFLPMFRVLLIFFLLLTAVFPLCAADSREQFMTAYDSCQQGEALERSGNIPDALNKYRFSESLLVAISKNDPSWNKLVIEYRLKKVREALARLQGNGTDATTPSGGGGSSPDESSPASGDASPAPSPAVQNSNSTGPSIIIVPPSSSDHGSSSSVASSPGASSKETRRLQKIIADLRGQLQDANDALGAQKQRANDLQNADWVQQRSELSAKLDVANRKISDLERDLHSHDSWGIQLKDLQKKLDDTVADKLVEEEQYEDRLKRVGDENSGLLQQLQAAKNKVVAATDSKKKIEGLNQEVQSGKDALQELQAKLEKADQLAKESVAKNDTIQTQLAKTTEQLALVEKKAAQDTQLRATIKDLQSKTDQGADAIRRNVALQADVQVLEEDRDRLEEKVSQLGQAAQEATKVKGLTAETEILKKTVAVLQEKVSSGQKEIDKAHDAADAATKEMAQTKQIEVKSLADTEADRDVLEEEQERLLSKVTQASLWLNALQKQGASLLPLKSEVEQLKGQLSQNTEALEQTTIKLSQSEQSADALRAHAAQTELAARNFSSLLKKQNTALEEQLKTALGQISSSLDHSADSSALQAQLKKLQEQMDLNAKNYAESQQQFAELSKAQPDEQKLLSEKIKELADAQGNAAKLQSQLTDASQQIENLKGQGNQNQGEARLKELQDELADRDAKIELLKKQGANGEEEQAMEENTLLRGIVLREIKDEAKRAQAHRVMEDELKRLNVQSDTLQTQMSTLAAPVVNLTDQERALFKDAELVVTDQGDDMLQASISAPMKKGGSAVPATPQTNGASVTGGDKGTNASPSGIPWQGKFKELLAQAKDEFDRQDYLEAENTFQESLKLSPNDYFALSNLGVVEFQLGKMKEAEEALEKASQQSSKNSFALTTLGIVHYRQKRLQDAETVLRQSIGVDGKDFTAHNYLGIVLAASGKGKEGESEIMRAIEINPNYADAHFNLAVIYATGKPPAKMMAREHYKKALDLGSPPDASLEHLLE